uniref:hypothetical protein n=1 Tax=Thiolapillus sp. TaxID=2017437 RepID=UPI003AF6F2ED
WNDGNTINYTPFSQDADTASFSDKERHDMWLGWAEAAEDYAPFNINVTTDSALYAATPEEQRVQLITTTTCGGTMTVAPAAWPIGMFLAQETPTVQAGYGIKVHLRWE